MKLFGGKHKIVSNYESLQRITNAFRELGDHIVVTVGSWDMLHIGHVRYLIKAKSFGDVLIVGADSDRAVKLYKGEDRPIIPQEERLEMLSYQSPVDFVTLVDDVGEDGRWQYGLVRAIRPETFVAVTDSYPTDQLAMLRGLCGRVEILERQADTSTSKKIGEVVKIRLITLKRQLHTLIEELE